MQPPTVQLASYTGEKKQSVRRFPSLDGEKFQCLLVKIELKLGLIFEICNRIEITIGNFVNQILSSI